MTVGDALKITYSNNPKPKDIKIIWAGLEEHNRKCGVMGEQYSQFGFYLKQDKKIVGGCLSDVYFNHQMIIDSLWVHEQFRGMGYGTKLLQAAEELARKKHIPLLTVFTMNWQAPDFYQKLGYYIEFQRSGYPNNGSVYLLRKDI